MLLAAGRGERMRPLSDATPKPLLEAGGHPLVEYHLRGLAAAGVTEVVVNLSWLGGSLRAALGDGSRWGLAIRYSDEGPVALDTGGGIHRALDWLGPGPFLLVNGDVWSDLRLSTLALPAGSLAELVLVDNPPHNPRGDYGLAADGHVVATPPLLTYAGIAVIDPALFDGCQPGRYPLKPLLDAALAEGRLSGRQHRGAWSDVGTPERLAALDAALRSGRLQHPELPAQTG